MSRARSLPANNSSLQPTEADAPLDAPCDDGCCEAPPSGAKVRRLPIVNKRGLHARASAKFVQTVERFAAEVTVCRNGEAVNGQSIMGLMMLAAGPGTSVTVTATGAEADAVLEALAQLVAERFGEDE